ncbi:unnamed protein product [Arabidopsis halleri]
METPAASSERRSERIDLKGEEDVDDKLLVMNRRRREAVVD